MASFSLKDPEKFDNDTKLTVFGYVRSIQSLLSTKMYHIIPKGIITICLVYYGGYDEWDKTTMKHNYLLKNRTITRQEEGLESCYGQKILESGEFSWKFRIEHQYKDPEENGGEEGGYICIGIWPLPNDDNNSVPPTDRFFGKLNNVDKSDGYGYSCTDATIVDWDGYTGEKKYGVITKTGDEIEMILNLDKLTLKYIVNGKDQGIAYHKIKKAKYRAAVYMWFADDSITMLH